MQVLFPRCARLDVHKDTIVVCARCVLEPVHHEVRSFDGTTSGLLALHGCNSRGRRLICERHRECADGSC